MLEYTRKLWLTRIPCAVEIGKRNSNGRAGMRPNARIWGESLSCRRAPRLERRRLRLATDGFLKDVPLMAGRHS
jgi:hypothetical protein